MGRLGLILVVILGAFFAYQTMDAAFDYDKAAAQERVEYLARAGNRLSNRNGFKSSFRTKTVEVKAMEPARKVLITLQEPDGFILTPAIRNAELQRKCPIYGKSTLADNNVQTRVRYVSGNGRGLGYVALSPSICRRHIATT